MLSSIKKILLAGAAGALALSATISAQAGGYYGYGPYGAPPGYGPGYGTHPMRPPMPPAPGHRMGYPPSQRYSPAARGQGEQASADQGAGDGEVVMRGMRFVPSTIRIEAGDTVTWKQQDRVPHVVKAKGKGDFASGRLQAGETYSHTFDEPGTYDYYCSIHPSMRGKVVVE